MPLDHLTGARVYEEMKKALLTSDQPDVFFRTLQKAGALEPWFHELAELVGVPQNPKYHPEGDAFEHTMRVVAAAAKIRDTMRDPLAFMLACLTHDLGKKPSTVLNDKGAWSAVGHEHTGVPLTQDMLSRLCVPAGLIDYAKEMCALHMRVHTCFYGTARVSRTNILFDESSYPEELAWLVICDVRGTGADQAYIDEEEAFVLERVAAYREAAAQPMPDAGMLMAAGVEKGPALGRAIREARNLVLAGEDIHKAVLKAANSVEK